MNTNKNAVDYISEKPINKPYNAESEKKYTVKGIIINQDDSGYLRSCARELPSAEDIAEYARQFAGTHITDYFINVNGISAVYPSKVWTSYLDKYHEFADGKLTGIKDENLILGAHHVFETLGVDYIEIWHKEFRKIGINPWLSFRMNDAHDMAAYFEHGQASPLLSSFFFENPQFYRVKHHTGLGYMDLLPDYTYREVREHYLELIDEALERYDTHGIELDFQREMRLWHYGGEYAGLEILTGFMRDVNGIVSKYEKKYGHDIRIAVRAASDPVTCHEFGFDIAGWAAKGLIDMFIPAARYENNDGDIPVALWCSMLKPFGVEVVMCIEYANNKTWIKGVSGGFDIQTLAGLCSNAFSQGADKVYFYNYFRNMSRKNLATLDNKITTDQPDATDGDQAYWNAMTTLGSPDKLLTFNRRNIISYNDTVQVWKKLECQMPKTIPGIGTTSYFRIPVGDVAEGSRLFVKFSVSVDNFAEKVPVVFVNSQQCTFAGIGDCKGAFSKNKVVTFEIPEAAYAGGYMLIEIRSHVEFETDYMEIYTEAHP